MSGPRRAVLRYFLLPRRGDVVKWIILPVGFLVGTLTGGPPTRAALIDALVIWFCLELLVYQARYQWNDIRGFDADQRHPDGDRSRLPGPVEKKGSRVLWSTATAVAKVTTALLASVLVSARLGWTMALLSVLVFGLAALYEWLRARFTGRQEGVPDSVTAGVGAIWLVVGAGYALRAVSGLSLATDLDGWAFLAAVLAAWLFGIAWVTSRWAVEATAYARVEEDRLVWRATRDDAREHQLVLVHWLPAWDGAPRDLRSWAAARGGTPWSAPWNVAGALAGCAVGVGGLLLADSTPDTADLLLCGFLGLLASVAVLGSGLRREEVVALSIPVVVGAMAVAGVPEPWRVAAPWCIVAVAQSCYLRQDRASMGMFLRRTGAGSRRRAGATTAS